MTVAVPCLIFTALMETEIAPAALQQCHWPRDCLRNRDGCCVLAVRLAGIEQRTYLAPMIFGNTGNLGLPLAFFAFGDIGLAYAVVIFAIMLVYSFTFGIWFVAGGGSIWKAFKEPLVGATLLGALFLYRGWETPTFLTNTLTLIGQMAIPLMLITLGVAVARLKPGRVPREALISCFKFAICASAGWGVGVWFDLPPVPFAVLILQLTTPVAVTST